VTTLIFETHSTSTDNERGVASGHLDVPLSDVGRAQAAEMGTRYADTEIAVVYTSDLPRAVATADIAFKNRDIRRVADRRLRECDYGTWSRSPVEQLNGVRLRFIDEPFPGGESYLDAIRRVKAFLGDLRYEPGTVLIVSHRATWYALEHLINGRDLREVIAAPWRWQPGWIYELWGS
jgi:broad specificity phosphatase PhoE